MKFIVYVSSLFVSLTSFSIQAENWSRECVGYYKFDLPVNMEVALYVVNNMTNPPKEPESRNKVLIKRTRVPVITFGDSVYESGDDRSQAHFSEFYYGGYELEISTKSKENIDFSDYKEKVIDDYQFIKNSDILLEEYRVKTLNKPRTPEVEFNRRYGFLIKNHNNAFVVYTFRGYAIYINDDHRIYHFWSKSDAYTDDLLQNSDNQWKKKESEVKSLLNRFNSRDLYEVPVKQGFCIPYGFISDDSGHEPHNMAVAYRMKDHPDVTIFFQTLTSDPGPGDNRPDFELNEKDYVTKFWNDIYGSKFRDIKLYGKGYSYPEIDGRKAVAALAKFTRYDKTVDYGYVAYVKGKTPTEPTLMFYLIRKSSQATNNPPVDKKELEKMAEHIVASIKRR